MRIVKPVELVRNAENEVVEAHLISVGEVVPVDSRIRFVTPNIAYVQIIDGKVVAGFAADEILWVA